MEPVVEPLEQRQAAIVADPDQPLAGLDLQGLGSVDALEQAHARSARILSA
jgi:hypothetical protein